MTPADPSGRLSPAGNQVWVESARLRDELEDESVRRLARAMSDGELPEEDPVALATVMLGAFHHHIVRWIQRNGSTEDLLESAKGLRRVCAAGWEPRPRITELAADAQRRGRSCAPSCSAPTP